MTQLRYFLSDVNRMTGKHKVRLIHIWLSRSFWGILVYRIERSLFLVFGKYYAFVKLPLVPFLNIIQAYTNIEIHYKANIKGGINILHPSIGCVVSGHSIIGENLTITGGNIIGISKKCNNGDFVVGSNCNMGANATIIGPLKLGNKVTIGASACVTKSYQSDNIILTGVPAKPIKR